MPQHLPPSSLANAKSVNEWLAAADSPIHGHGLFAARTIPAGTRLIEYTGERITKAESLRRCEAGNVYIIGLDAETDLDGNLESNPARWINHRCDPNAEMVLDEEVVLNVRDEPVAPGGKLHCEGVTVHYRVFIDALREIAPGEEITFNYGYDLTDYRDHPCRCGAPACVGYIVAEAFFSQLRRKLRQAAAAETASRQ